MRLALILSLLSLSGCFNHRLILTYEQGDAALGSKINIASETPAPQEKKNEGANLFLSDGDTPFSM